MRMVNSGARLQFTLRANGDDDGLVIEVGDQTNPEIVLDVLGPFDAPVTEERFEAESDAWLNARTDTELHDLRERARAKFRPQRGTYATTTDLGNGAEAMLTKIARIAGRWDVYLGHEPSPGGKVEGWFVFGPWLRDFCGERFYQKPNRAAAIEFVNLAYARVIADLQQVRAYRSNTTAEGAAWVADRAARSRDLTLRRVVDVASIGGGGHVVTWEDTDGCFHTEEDYNNVSCIS